MQSLAMEKRKYTWAAPGTNPYTLYQAAIGEEGR